MYKTNLTVRGNELDSNNHVNNAVYLNYYEQGRWEAFREAGALETVMNSDLLLVVTDIRIRYIREANLLDELEVQTSFRKTSPFLVFYQKIFNRKTGLAVSRAETKTIFLNAAREPQDIPENICSILKL
jgi:YbgC/YbaW family acyl-CoA thioester hydrolase